MSPSERLEGVWGPDGRADRFALLGGVTDVLAFVEHFELHLFFTGLSRLHLRGESTMGEPKVPGRLHRHRAQDEHLLPWPDGLHPRFGKDQRRDDNGQ